MRAPARWLDVEGASLIGTMGKAWGEEMPHSMASLLRMLFLRQKHPYRPPGAEGTAAVESCALGVAHLLPALVTCARGFHSRFCRDSHASI